MSLKKEFILRAIVGVLALIMLFVPGIGMAVKDEATGVTTHASISAFDFYTNQHEAPLVMSSQGESVNLGIPVNVVTSLGGNSDVLTFVWIIFFAICAIALAIDLIVNKDEYKENKKAKIGSFLAVLAVVFLLLPYGALLFNRYFLVGSNGKELAHFHVSLWLIGLIVVFGADSIINTFIAGMKQKDKNARKQEAAVAAAIMRCKEEEEKRLNQNVSGETGAQQKESSTSQNIQN